MPIVSYSNKPAAIGLLVALALGSGAWSTSAQARSASMHLGNLGGLRSNDHPLYLHDHTHVARLRNGWYPWADSGLATGAIIGGAIVANETEPLYAAPIYPVTPSADHYWLAYCSQRYRSFDPATGTYLGYDGLRHACQ